MIAHICNDIGAWGRGFVLALSRRWSEPEQAYRRWHTERRLVLGSVQFVQVETALWVANMVAQHGLRVEGKRPPIRYESLEVCLEKVRREAERLLASVHMPRIGTGLAGGSWNAIGPIIERTLTDKGAAVTVYDLE